MALIGRWRAFFRLCYAHPLPGDYNVLQGLLHLVTNTRVYPIVSPGDSVL